MSARGKGGGLPLVDLLKAVACCLIVLHHLAFYGPMSDHAAMLFPSMFQWLGDPARGAVQVFLVLGGYLSARGLCVELAADTAVAVRDWDDCRARIQQRFLRLALPMWCALLLALLCNALAGYGMDHHSVSDIPDAITLAANVLMLQDITGHEALSAGLWYVAVDFQLHAMLCVMACVCARRHRPLLGLAVMVLVATTVSAFVFSRDPDWDIAAPYYWVSYGLGALMALCAPGRVSGAPNLFAWALGAVVLSLALDFRWRLMVACAAAIVLWVWLWHGRRVLRDIPKLATELSRISYSVFLVHFPVSLLVNTVWVTAVPLVPELQLIGVITAFKLSLVAGWSFHRLVEEPAGRWARKFGSRRSGSVSESAA